MVVVGGGGRGFAPTGIIHKHPPHTRSPKRGPGPTGCCATTTGAGGGAVGGGGRCVTPKLRLRSRCPTERCPFPGDGCGSARLNRTVPP